MACVDDAVFNFDIDLDTLCTSNDVLDVEELFDMNMPLVAVSAPIDIPAPSIPCPKVPKKVKTASLTTSVYTMRPKISARNDHTAITCGCRQHFFWEMINPKNVNFYRGTTPDSVDHCVSSSFVYNKFSQAFWDAYGHCVGHAKDTFFATHCQDWTIAVCQMHDQTQCPKEYTRYTLGSVKDFILYNEQLRLYPVIGAFCHCRCTLSPANIVYNVCFTCLQCVLELKVMSCVGIEEHFSYEVCYKASFLASLLPCARNKRVFFLAQALFEHNISTSTPLTDDTAVHKVWNPTNDTWQKDCKTIVNKSFCMICRHPGNGFQDFVCSTCIADKMVF